MIIRPRTNECAKYTFLNITISEILLESDLNYFLASRAVVTVRFSHAGKNSKQARRTHKYLAQIVREESANGAEN